MGGLRQSGAGPAVSSPSAAADPPPGSTPRAQIAARREQRREAKVRRRRRRRRTFLLVAVPVLLSPVIYSYATWMLRPSSIAFFPRSVEWVRADVPLGNQLVDEIEHVYYSWNAPTKGGPQLTSLPPTGAAVKAPNEAAPGPQRIKPVFPHRLPGEGVWKPTGPPVQGGAPVLVTTFRPELDYPRIVAYVAWFDHTRTALAFYPGRYEPPHAAVRGPMMVPNDQRRRLLATQQRLHLLGHEQRLDRQRPHQRAAREGQRHARRLSRWPRRDREVGRRRQCRAERCLGPPEPAPIIWNGRLNPALNDSSQWGFTVGNAVRVWRTGVGIDRRGNLIFAAADDQTVITLARILQRAGAIRAMQFDINADWHTLITYTHHHGLRPTQVGPSNQPSTRYLSPDDRDFFAVYRRLSGPVTVPSN
jgi:hypothetical protein